jgi:small-conductance mechanosensitive channel
LQIISIFERTIIHGIDMIDWNKYIVPFLYFAGCFIVGIFVENILKHLSLSSRKTKWRGDEVIFHSFRGMGLTGSIIIGLYLAFHNSDFPVAIISIADKILFAVGMLAIAIVTSRMMGGFIHLKSNTGSIYPSTSIVSNIAKIGIYILCVLVVLQTNGVSITPLLTALGVGALAVALALQDTLSNLFSGLQVIASRQIRIGDYIKLNTNEEGYVSDITWRNTIIRALSNNYIIVPNSKIASAIVTNYYLPEKEMSVNVEASVSYDSDLEKVEAVTIAVAREVLKETTGAVKDADTFIRYHTFGDSEIKFSVNLRAMEFTDQYLLKHVFIKKLTEAYRSNNIAIPYPIRNVIVKNTANEK